MKNGLILHNGTVEVKEVPFPEPGDNDVLVEMICTLLPSGQGGHLSSIGRVVDFGMNVFDFNLGERVYPLADLTSQVSEALSISELSVYADAIRNVTLCPIPDEISDLRAGMITPFLLGCRAARSGMMRRDAYEVASAIQEQTSLSGDPRYQFGESAVVFGAGLTGIASAIALLWFGMERVLICDTSDARLAAASRLGFEVCNLLREDFFSQASAFDCWIDIAGTDAAAPAFLHYGRKGSRFVAAAPLTNPQIIDFGVLAESGKSFTGCGAPDLADLDDVMQIMESNFWDLDGLVTASYSLDQLEEAYALASQEDGDRVVMIMG